MVVFLPDSLFDHSSTQEQTFYISFFDKLVIGAMQGDLTVSCFGNTVPITELIKWFYKVLLECSWLLQILYKETEKYSPVLFSKQYFSAILQLCY